MILVEQGRIRLWDKVKTYVPDFAPYLLEKGVPDEDARLYHLLTHTSGLPPYTDPKEAEKQIGNPCSTDDLVNKIIARLPKETPAGKQFTYSCLNYITLAYIVKKTTGQTIAEFSAENVFKPLGMKRTFYNPPSDVLSLCVPTQVVDGKPLLGVVHDPLARLQGGVSGNAGLFSTADDLAVFAQMMLRGGEWNGVRILSPLAVERMVEIFPKVAESGRGLGWDLTSDYGTVRGDLFGYGSYGHSGYTGTSIWIDPETQTAVIFLTNRVHPDDKGDIIAMRSKVSNVVASSIFKK
jgi:CubicO group peptidase (beta-lactamase class C family)